MAAYSYKDVVYRDDFQELIPEFEKQARRECDGDSNYDGDHWTIADMLLTKKDETIRQQQAEIDRLKEYEEAVHAHFDVAFHSYDSTKSVYDNLSMLQSWHCAVALDPKVSKEAAELHDKIDRLTEQRDRLLNDLKYLNAEIGSLTVKDTITEIEAGK